MMSESFLPNPYRKAEKPKVFGTFWCSFFKGEGNGDPATQACIYVNRLMEKGISWESIKISTSDNRANNGVYMCTVFYRYTEKIEADD